MAVDPDRELPQLQTVGVDVQGALLLSDVLPQPPPGLLTPGINSFGQEDKSELL